MLNEWPLTKLFFAIEFFFSFCFFLYYLLLQSLFIALHVMQKNNQNLKKDNVKKN